MLISYPVLGTSKVQESEYGGRYPVAVFKDSMHEGLTSGWHGGLHLTVNGTSTGGPVVRAIADGTVVAYRVPTKQPEKKDELEKHALNYGGSWTDDGFVLLKHEKECGEKRPVVFYSLYMHLGKVAHPDLDQLKAAPGELKSAPKKRVKVQGQLQETTITITRKEIMGEAGRISGQTGQLHFEIFASDDDFKKFFPPAPSIDTPTTEGFLDPWGELYYLIKAGRPYFREKPQGTAVPATSLTVPADLRIGITYREGRIFYRSLDDNGLELEQWESADREAEYNLHRNARSLDRDKMSRAYELMRFARFMTWPDLDGDPKPTPGQCWHYLPMLDGWVDLADDAVPKLSDADFPKWCWERVDAAKAGFDPSSGLCDVSKLLSAIDENGDGNLSELEFTNWRKHCANKALLNQLAVQFQSEWDGSEPDKRWGWIKTMWGDRGKHEQAALKHKQEWVKAQKEKAEKGKPELQKRIQQVGDWQAKLEGMKQDAEKALADAVKKHEDADKAKKDFSDTQKAALEPTTPKKQHDLAVAAKVKELSKRSSDALEARKQAEKKAKSFDTAIERAKAWKAREEAKLQAAEDVIQKAQPTLSQLDEAIKISAQKSQDPKAAEQAANDFEDYKKHMSALQFWEEVKKKVDAQAKKEEDKFPNSQVWHFHPLYFIEFFKRCHWLSEGELEAIYPDKMEHMEGGKSWNEPISNKNARETYRLHINRVLWKYGWTSSARMAHFFGQAWIESTALTMIREGSEGDFRKESLAPEPNAYYKNPWDIYYTHVVNYNAIASNTDKERLVDSKGNPVDLSADFKKSDKEIAEKIKNAKDSVFDENPWNAKIRQAIDSKKDANTIAHLEKQKEDAGKAFEMEKKKRIQDLEAESKNQKGRYRKIAKERVDQNMSDPGDGQKFRGRGLKQLTNRENYAAYWVWRGWLKERMRKSDSGDFDWHWWDTPGKVPAPIPDPQRISENPFNAVDWLFAKRCG